jgi:hypothetical protein
MRRLPNFSGLFCTVLLALGALAFVTTNPTPVSAVPPPSCGVNVGMAKNCQTPKIVGDKTNCTITLTNRDTDTDSTCTNTYEINSGKDVVHSSGGDVTESGLPISAVSGTTTCTVSGSLPCDLSPGASVTFHDNNYTIQSADYGLTSHALTDTGIINMTDLCDHNSNGCASIAVDESAPAATIVQACSVTIDKQISCDEGVTWTNADAASTGVVTGICTGFTGDAIQVRFVVHNSGDTALTSCNIHDVVGTNPLSSGGTEYTQDYSTGLDNIASGGTVTSSAITLGADGQTALTCDAAGPNNDTAKVDCTCGTSSVTTSDDDTATFSCESCSVQIDKQVNCAAAGYVDVFPSDDSVNGDTPPTADTEIKTCTGYDEYTGHTADNIAVQYVIKNTGDDGLNTCTYSESNSAIITGTPAAQCAPAAISDGTNTPGTLTSGQSTTTKTFTNACSPDLIQCEASGEDTATIGCACDALENNTKTRSVGFHDTAGFNCLAPGLNVTKTCDQQSGTTNAVHIAVTNSGGVDLTGCSLTDAYQTSDTCSTPPVDLVNPTDATSSLLPSDFANFDLSSGAPEKDYTGSISGLTDNACNQASVTCTVAGTQQTITATSQDTCEVSSGCETRTPGFWKTHPDTSYAVMTAAGGFIQSCGLDLNNVLPGVDCSAIEDMCSLGQDAAKLGIDPVQANLIFQCAAAELNLQVTQQDGGSCGNTIPNSNLMFDACCGLGGACATGGADLNACQAAVSAFNALYDNTTLTSGSVLNNPGASPGNCQTANGNLIVNDQAGGADCNGSRTYLQKSTGKNAPTNNGKALGKNK